MTRYAPCEAFRALHKNRNPQWRLGFFDDKSDSLCHCRSAVSPDVPNRVVLYGHIRPRNWISRWSSNTGLNYHGYAAVCERGPTSIMFTDDMVIRARRRLARLRRHSDRTAILSRQLSSTAFSNIVPIAVTGLSGSYVLGIALLLWRRATGHSFAQ